jgi:predicted RNA-binding protein associated with RNAse of E/G family
VKYTDLLLDVLVPADGEALLLDEDELAEAVATGHLDEPTAAEVTALGEAILVAPATYSSPLWHGLDPLRLMAGG